MRAVYPYRIHLSSIISARGQLSVELKNKIEIQSAAYCKSLDNDLDPQDGWLPAKSILNDFLKGAPLDFGNNSSKHWYIVEMLCNGFGKQLTCDKWEDTNLDDFYEYDEFRMYYLGQDASVSIPAPEIYPLVFTIENNNLEKAKLHIDNGPHSLAEKIQFLDWVQTTMDHGQDLILFSY